MKKRIFGGDKKGKDRKDIPQEEIHARSDICRIAADDGCGALFAAALRICFWGGVLCQHDTFGSINICALYGDLSQGASQSAEDHGGYGKKALCEDIYNISCICAPVRMGCRMPRLWRQISVDISCACIYCITCRFGNTRSCCGYYKA